MKNEELSKLSPAFKNNGILTAGNLSGANDEVSAVLITSRELADRLNMGRK
jgi:acetyl-CoA C-acetyltransferase